MEEEKSLSSKIKTNKVTGTDWITADMVREAVLRLKEKIKKGKRKSAERYGICDYCDSVINDYIEEIFGEEFEETE